MVYTEEDKIKIGEKLAEVMQLKEVKGYYPARYKTTWGTKTARGLYETIKRIILCKD